MRTTIKTYLLLPCAATLALGTSLALAQAGNPPPSTPPTDAPPVTPPSAVPEKHPTLDSEGAGTMDTDKRKGSASNSTKAANAKGTKSVETFSRMDANSDGELSHAEIKGDSQLQSEFKSADKDRNGRLSRQEYLSYSAEASKSGASANAERKTN